MNDPVVMQSWLLVGMGGPECVMAVTGSKLRAAEAKAGSSREGGRACARLLMRQHQNYQHYIWPNC